MTTCRGSAVRGGFWHLRVAQNASESDVEAPSARPNVRPGADCGCSVHDAILSLTATVHAPDTVDLGVSQITSLHGSPLCSPGTVAPGIVMVLQNSRDSQCPRRREGSSFLHYRSRARSQQGCRQHGGTARKLTADWEHHRCDSVPRPRDAPAQKRVPTELT